MHLIIAIPVGLEYQSLGVQLLVEFGPWERGRDAVGRAREPDLLGVLGEPQYLFLDTEVFVWEGLPTIESLNDSSRNTMLADWVRSWRLVKEGNTDEENHAAR